MSIHQLIHSDKWGMCPKNMTFKLIRCTTINTFLGCNLFISKVNSKLYRAKKAIITPKSLVHSSQSNAVFHHNTTKFRWSGIIMGDIPQNLCRCHTKRRISEQGPANPSFNVTHIICKDCRIQIYSWYDNDKNLTRRVFAAPDSNDCEVKCRM